MRHYFVFIVLLILLSCSNEENGLFSVRGNVTLNNAPVSGVAAAIDDKFNLSNETNEDGFFSISGISPGDHILSLTKTFQPEEFGTVSSLTSEKILDLSVNEDLSLEVIDLPRPNVLSSATNVTHSSAVLRWTGSNDDDFRTYVLYRSTSPEVSETSGTKVYATVVSNDTSFRDTGLETKSSYYYRLYTLLGPGEKSTSNIITVMTSNIQAITNSSFETLDTDGNPAGWSLYKNVTTELKVDTGTASEGSKSLKFTHTLEEGCYELFIIQTINRSLLEPGSRYKLKFKYKSDFTSTHDVSVIMTFAAEWYSEYFEVRFNSAAGWSDFEGEFVLQETLGSNDLRLTLDFCIPLNVNWWIDEVTLEKV